MDAIAERSLRIEQGLVWSLAVGVALLSIPNIFFANWTATYHGFWTDTFQHKPMSVIASLLCRYGTVYRLASVLLLGGCLVPLFSLRFAVRVRIVLCVLVFAALQLLTSLYFMPYQWLVTAVNGRMLPMIQP